MSYSQDKALVKRMGELESDFATSGISFPAYDPKDKEQVAEHQKHVKNAMKQYPGYDGKSRHYCTVTHQPTGVAYAHACSDDLDQLMALAVENAEKVGKPASPADQGEVIAQLAAENEAKDAELAALRKNAEQSAQDQKPKIGRPKRE